MICDKTRYFGIFRDRLQYFTITVATELSFKTKNQSKTSLSMPKAYLSPLLFTTEPTT